MFYIQLLPSEMMKVEKDHDSNGRTIPEPIMPSKPQPKFTIFGESKEKVTFICERKLTKSVFDNGIMIESNFYGKCAMNLKKCYEPDICKYIYIRTIDMIKIYMMKILLIASGISGKHVFELEILLYEGSVTKLVNKEGNHYLSENIGIQMIDELMGNDKLYINSVVGNHNITTVHRFQDTKKYHGNVYISYCENIHENNFERVKKGLNDEYHAIRDELCSKYYELPSEMINPPIDPIVHAHKKARQCVIS